MHNVLVTGGTGGIGTELVKLLCDRGHEVYVYARTENNLFKLREKLDNRYLRRFVCGDIRNYPRLEYAMQGIDTVYHLASMRMIGFCDENPHEAADVIIHGTENVCRAAHANKVKNLVMVSTSEAVNPTNVYGCAKLIAERITLDSNYTVHRFPNVLGGNGSIIPRLIPLIKRGEKIPLYGLNTSRIFISIPQAAEQLAWNHFPARQVTYGANLQWAYIRDVIDVVADRLGVPVEYELCDPRHGERHTTTLADDYVASQMNHLTLVELITEVLGEGG